MSVHHTKQTVLRANDMRGEALAFALTVSQPHQAISRNGAQHCATRQEATLLDELVEVRENEHHAWNTGDSASTACPCDHGCGD